MNKTELGVNDDGSVCGIDHPEQVYLQMRMSFMELTSPDLGIL